MVQLAGFGCNVWVKVVRERIPAQLVTIALPEMVYERIRQGARPTMPTDSRERLATVYETQWHGLNRSTDNLAQQGPPILHWVWPDIRVLRRPCYATQHLR